jgi:hypothetical protein
VIIAVAAALTISGTFASVATGAVASASGVSPKPISLGMIVADQLFRQALGDVGGADVVLDFEDDLLAGDRVAVLPHVKLCAGALLLAG